MGFFLLFSLMKGFSQEEKVSIIQVPLLQYLSLQDVWKAELMNHSSHPLKVYLIGKIIKDGSLILYQNRSKTLDLPPGLKQLNLSNFPIARQNSWANDPFQEGHFRVCLEVYSLEGKLLGENCREMQIVPPTPPYLVYPFDKDELETDQPTFSWTPPAPILSGQILRYRLEIKEIHEGQTAEAAIQTNPPFYFQEGLPSNIHPYPVIGRRWDHEKSYAWRIEAFDQNRSLGKSEVWSFSFKRKAEKKKEVAERSFVPLLQSRRTASYLAFEEVKFRFDCRYAEDKVNYLIQGESRRLMKILPDQFEKVGDNRFVIHLPAGSGFRENKTYTLEVRNGLGETFYLPFIYQFDRSLP